jgi:hypothetical protein
MGQSQERQRNELPCAERKELESKRRIFKLLHIWMTCCFMKCFLILILLVKPQKIQGDIVIIFV